MALASDFAGVLDIDWALSTVKGEMALAQAILRRLTTPLGGLEDDPLYGYDIRDLIGTPVTASIVEQRVREQVLAEEEVDRCAVRVTQAADSIFIEIRLRTIAGTASLTLNSTSLTLEALFNGLPVTLAANDQSSQAA